MKTRRSVLILAATYAATAAGLVLTLQAGSSNRPSMAGGSEGAMHSICRVRKGPDGQYYVDQRREITAEEAALLETTITIGPQH